MASFAQNRTTPYDFPVKPGTSEWRKLQSRTEMATATQIPGDILKNLTTEALAKTCLTFPLFKDLYFFNSPQVGFDGLKQSFNGFQELLNRNDAGVELTRLYKQMNPEGIKSPINDTAKGDFAFQFVQIEILLAQDQIISTLSASAKSELLTEASQKYTSKKATGGFSGFTLAPSILIIGRILDKENKLQTLKTELSNDIVQNFLTTGVTDKPEILERILSASKD